MQLATVLPAKLLYHSGTKQSICTKDLLFVAYPWAKRRRRTVWLLGDVWGLFARPGGKEGKENYGHGRLEVDGAICQSPFSVFCVIFIALFPPSSCQHSSSSFSLSPSCLHNLLLPFLQLLFLHSSSHIRKKTCCCCCCFTFQNCCAGREGGRE